MIGCYIYLTDRTRESSETSNSSMNVNVDFDRDDVLVTVCM